jgi:signal transduction histidine kinase
VSLPRFVRTAAFRLALFYALIFAASSLALFTFLYWRISQYAQDQLHAAMESEISLLASEGASDIGELTREVGERASAAESSASFYLLQTAAGEAIAGNVGPMRPRAGFFEEAVAPRRGEHGERKPILFDGRLLPNGYFLAIGREQADVQALSAVVSRAFLLAGLGSGILAIIGGIVVGSGFLRRIETINRTIEGIIAGKLSQRVPGSETKDELDRLAANLNRMLDRIQDLMREVRQVSDDIAHDLRTPLARLRQKLESMLAHHGGDERQRAELQAAIGDMDDLLATFAALLRIAQIESGARTAEFADVDLSALVHSIADAYEPVAEDQGQRLERRIAPGARIRGDRQLLTQLVANLIENALRHAPGSPVVEIGLEQGADGRPVLVVADHGPGIPADEQDKVFRRFYRVEHSRTTPGSGLGLSLVAAVAALHGLDALVEDNRPGTRVRIVPGKARKRA